MKRAPLVVGGTAVGLALLLTYHPHPARLSIGASSSSTTAPATTSPASTKASAPKGASGTTGSGSGTTGGRGTFTGTPVNYNYGTLSVQITVSGSRITKVGIASLTDGGNFRSQSIDQQAVPVLEQQAMAAQSAKIQGVSGASYTSAGFERSLQSALTKAGL